MQRKEYAQIKPSATECGSKLAGQFAAILQPHNLNTWGEIDLHPSSSSSLADLTAFFEPSHRLFTSAAHGLRVVREHFVICNIAEPSLTLQPFCAAYPCEEVPSIAWWRPTPEVIAA